MNKIKRILCLALALAMMLCLAGCASFERKIAKAANLLAKEENYCVDFKLDMPIAISVLGQTMEMDSSVTVIAEVQTEPMIIKMQLSMGELMAANEFLAYASYADDVLVIYLSADKGATWQKTTQIVESSAKKPNSLTMIAALSTIAKNFEQVGTEKILGSNASRFDGYIAGDQLETLFANYDRSSLPAGTEGIFENMADMDMSIWVDEASGKFARIGADLSEMLAPTVQNMVEDAVSQQGLSGFGFTVDIEAIELELSFYDYGKVGALEIPDEAKSAKETSAIAA